MNKSELVKQIAATTDLSQAQAERCLTAFTDSVAKTLSQGDKLTLLGFGTFETRERAARTGRNPQTGEEMTIPSAKVPAFKAGQGLKDAVKG
ncbi:HU family DNA-binding protein [Halomonas sabkhae]|uniref:HU family DNA-binding protein n=1 Tax=Halomonas sabkhae TaxID=626223 RepID=UPI0025B57623|nr:HU family DNA-binding protein [Halomonas sabkhae]MDN3525295.1 HU family DNA-binding protein [Halomonas sabkhae]